LLKAVRERQPGDPSSNNDDPKFGMKALFERVANRGGLGRRVHGKQGYFAAILKI
jgi:hypothetical protein